MFGFTPENIIELITHYGYLIILPISILEGPILAVISGFIASLGYLDVKLVFIVLLFGDIIGDSLYYVFGYWGGKRFVRRFGKYIGVTEERVRALEIYFHTHSIKILMIAKAQPVGSAVLFFAGLAKMSYKKFIWYNILGTIPKIIILEATGFYFGYGYERISNYLDYTGILFFVAAAALIAVYWIFYRRQSKKLDI